MLIEFAGLEVRRNHAAGLNQAALRHFVIAKRTHASFRPDSQNTVRRQRIAQRAQTIPIKASDCPTAIISRDASRAIPRLHHGIAVIVQSLMRRGHHGIAFGPGFRNKHGFCHRS